MVQLFNDKEKFKSKSSSRYLNEKSICNRICPPFTYSSWRFRNNLKKALFRNNVKVWITS